MNIEKININDIKKNKENPRVITDEKYKKLLQSIKDFPEMLEARPLVIDENNIVLGGNMRLKACKEAGLKEVPVIKWTDLSDAKKKEFIVKDNLGYGDWDWDVFKVDWDFSLLDDWGLDVPGQSNGDGENPYTSKIEAPIYEPGEIKPTELECYDTIKWRELCDEIERSGVSDSEKEFLKMAATRHIKFNYRKIADLYAHSSAEMQGLMENSALVIIDFNKAIELGYVSISEKIIKKYNGDEE